MTLDPTLRDTTQEHWDDRAEAALLGAILTNPTLYHTLTVDPLDLYRYEHRDTYRVIQRLAEDDEPIDQFLVATSLSEQPPDHDRAYTIQAATTLTLQLTESVPAITNAAAYAERVAELGRTRRLSIAARHVASSPTPEALAYLEAATQRYHAGANGTTPIRVATITRLDQAEDTDPPKPEWLGLFVPHALSAIYGPSGDGKSWLTALLMLEVARLGGESLVIDYEGPASRLKRRMKLLGATRDELALITHARPTSHLAAAAASLGEGKTLVVVDAVIGLLSAHGWSPKKDDEVELAKTRILDPLGADGAARVTVDHVVKDPEARGGHATGSERKRGQVDFGYEITSIKTHRLRPGHIGKLKVAIHKDRDGSLEALAYTVQIDASVTPYTWTITPIDHASSDTAGEPLRPTFLMERVSRYLERNTHAPPSMTRITQEVEGKAEYLRSAAEHLVREGYAREVPGPRNARLFQHIRIYTEAADNDPGPQDAPDEF